MHSAILGSGYLVAGQLSLKCVDSCCRGYSGVTSIIVIVRES